LTVRPTLTAALLVGILLIGCSTKTPAPPAPAPDQSAVAEQATAVPLVPTATEVPPTATPSPTPEPPAAARVNGQLITLEDFEKELARYEAAQRSLGNPLSAEEHPYQSDVLDYLIEQTLIEQAAVSEGIGISDQELDAEIERLKTETGAEAFESWLQTNQYSMDEFRKVLRAQLTTQAMIDRVASSVGPTADQVHARHIVVASAETAEAITTQLEQGADFATLARTYSLDESTRMNGGDLGFFPRGLLLAPEVEEAAFSLAVGETSQIIESDFGIHIVQVLERDPARPLSAEIQQRLRAVAFEKWLDQLWQTATVERNI
jgi:peptidyl-prolyl cis-trans isomerase C